MRNAKTVVVVLALCAAGAGGGVAVAVAKPRPARPPARATSSTASHACDVASAISA